MYQELMTLCLLCGRTEEPGAVFSLPNTFLLVILIMLSGKFPDVRL